MSGHRSARSGAGPVDRETVRDRLDRVTDPELDRSIVELEYVDRIDVDGGRVEVALTLPTAWCSPAFAWMMAEDARDEVAALPGVTEVAIELREHMHAREITHGVNSGSEFGSAFPDADGGVAEVRATLDDKARLSRQHEAVSACLDAGLRPEQVVSLRGRDLELADEGAVIAVDGIRVVADREPVERYLAKARTTGHVTEPDDRVFLTPEGDPIPPERFDVIRKRTRLAGVNMGGQGAVCDALNRARRAKLDRS
ncbi:MAG: iron-sulfur cluster assembly protein [Halosimplex sp.]